MAGHGCMRIILFTTNFLIFVCGALLLSFGIVGVASPTTLTNMIAWIPGVKQLAYIINIPSVIVSGSVFMIVLGSVMVVFGFLGCGGAAFQFKLLLFLYWLLLIFLIMAEVALIIYAAVSPQQVSTQVQSAMMTSLKNNFQPAHIDLDTGTIQLPSNIVALSWTSMQFEVACCGVYNASDYQTFTWNNTYLIPPPPGTRVTALIPESCCTLNTGGGTVPPNYSAFVNLQGCLTMTMPTAYNSKGCYSTVQNLAKQYSYISIAICSVVIGIEIVSMIFGIILWRQKGKKPTA